MAGVVRKTSVAKPLVAAARRSNAKAVSMPVWPLPRGSGQTGMDTAFALLLLAAATSGFATLVFRTTPAMPVLLEIHLGIVLGLFLTLPYGKFVHALYRFA